MTAVAGRILGIDYGSKRIGLALSDPMQIIAQGAGTFNNDGTFLAHLSKVIQSREVVRIVVGMPYAADGGRGSKAREVEAFIHQLTRLTNIHIDTWDESYSSVRAQRSFIETGMRKKKRKQKHLVDEMAARLMLQEYLDQQRREGT